MATRRSARKLKFYSVACGRDVGLFTNWFKCEESVSGFKGQAFKGFNTVPAAISYLEEYGIHNPTVYHGDSKITTRELGFLIANGKLFDYEAAKDEDEDENDKGHESDKAEVDTSDTVGDTAGDEDDEDDDGDESVKDESDTLGNGTANETENDENKHVHEMDDHGEEDKDEKCDESEQDKTEQDECEQDKEQKQSVTDSASASEIELNGGASEVKEDISSYGTNEETDVQDGKEVKDSKNKVTKTEQKITQTTKKQAVDPNMIGVDTIKLCFNTCLHNFENMLLDHLKELHSETVELQTKTYNEQLRQQIGRAHV